MFDKPGFSEPIRELEKPSGKHPRNGYHDGHMPLEPIRPKEGELVAAKLRETEAYVLAVSNGEIITDSDSRDGNPRFLINDVKQRLLAIPSKVVPIIIREPVMGDDKLYKPNKQELRWDQSHDNYGLAIPIEWLGVGANTIITRLGSEKSDAMRAYADWINQEKLHLRSPKDCPPYLSFEFGYKFITR